MDSREVKASRAAYMREWRRKNPEKSKAIHERYWLNRAKRELAEQQAEQAVSNAHE